jgi:two-component system, OmpR family, response regulator RegX3
MLRILVVEDKQSCSDTLPDVLRKEGFDVAVAATGPQALTEFDRTGADLVLLDLMLPQTSGVEVCRELRACSDVPIIIVSTRDSEVDKVVGLEIGADDYITKPYSLRELLARIRAVHRRHQPNRATPAVSVLNAGPVHMDLDRHVVTINSTEIPLALKEFQLLELLLRNAGRVLTRTELIDQIWGPQYAGDTKTLDVHIRRLRSKIETDPAAPRHLQTLCGVGYTFQP